MGIEWTIEAKDALRSAWRKWLAEGGKPDDEAALIEALDAAVKAQTEGVLSTAGPKLEFAMEAYRQGRADALEEAAKIAEGTRLWKTDFPGASACDLRSERIAAAIRALKDADKPVPADYT